MFNKNILLRRRSNKMQNPISLSLKKRDDEDIRWSPSCRGQQNNNHRRCRRPKQHILVFYNNNALVDCCLLYAVYACNNSVTISSQRWLDWSTVKPLWLLMTFSIRAFRSMSLSFLFLCLFAGTVTTQQWKAKIQILHTARYLNKNSTI